MSNKQQTPLQRLIAQLEDRIEFCLDGGCDTNQTEIDTLDIVIMTAKDLLPYEREVIEKNAKDFFYWWYNQTKGTNTEEAAQQYFNLTFQTNE